MRSTGWHSWRHRRDAGRQGADGHPGRRRQGRGPHRGRLGRLDRCHPGRHDRLLGVGGQGPAVVDQRLGRIPGSLPELAEGHEGSRVVRVDRKRVEQLVFRRADVTMLFGKPSQFDVGLWVGRLAGGPLLEPRNRLVRPVFLHEQHGESPLAGLVVRISGQAEVVILLGHLPVGRAAKHLRLLVVGSAEVVEAVGIARLAGECLLEVVDCAEVIALLIELHSLGRIVATHTAAAGSREAQKQDGSSDKHAVRAPPSGHTQAAFRSGSP